MISYYFPGLIDTVRLPETKSKETSFNLNSGSNAVRLILRSFNLKQGAKVALPLYVCDSLKEAVIKEGLQPVYLDLIAPGTFWASYDERTLLEYEVAAVILVHPYGYIHPDNEKIIKFCKDNKIFLVHDTAQSYGVDESKLEYGSVFYSFGPGKSSTAAGGGMIKDMDTEFYKKNVSRPSMFSNLRAYLFMKSRIYGATYSLADKVGLRIISRIHEQDKLYGMNSLQQKASNYVLQLIPKKKDERTTKYNLLKQALIGHPYLVTPYEHKDGLNFRMVIYVKEGKVEAFKSYLGHNKVPYHCLYRGISLGNENIDRLSNYKSTAHNIIDVSCEACLPISEVERVAKILKNFN